MFEEIRNQVLKQARLAETLGLCPVSYTHLDVYKRQACFYLLNQTAAPAA